MLIRGSLTIQEKDMVATRGEGSGRRVLVIGGAGHMGRWFARYLGAQGFTVEIADPAEAGRGRAAGHRPPPRLAHGDARSRADRGGHADAGHGRDPRGAGGGAAARRGVRHRLAEEPAAQGLHALRAAGGNVTSVHPMFGPDTELLSGRHVIFVDLGAPQADRRRARCSSRRWRPWSRWTSKSHDRLIAYVLGLSHALNIAFFTALAESGEAAPRLATLSSTTFDAQLGVAAQVSREHPDLYFEIQSLNDYGTESLAALLYAVERLRSVVRAGDLEGFRALMARGRSYLSGR